MDDYFEYAAEHKIELGMNPALVGSSAPDVNSLEYWKIYFVPCDEYEIMVEKCNEIHQARRMERWFDPGECPYSRNNKSSSDPIVCTGW